MAPNAAVMERKTRPIYDALNRGDFKVRPAMICVQIGIPPGTAAAVASPPPRATGSASTAQHLLDRLHGFNG